MKTKRIELSLEQAFLNTIFNLEDSVNTIMQASLNEQKRTLRFIEFGIHKDPLLGLKQILETQKFTLTRISDVLDNAKNQTEVIIKEYH